MRVKPLPQVEMRPPRRGGAALDGVWLLCSLCLLGSFAPSLVSSITVSTPAELQASKGDAVKLSCTFTSTSRPTSKMTVDWSYRPQSGGPPHDVFHFSSKAFLPPDGQFADRIRWEGIPARGDASISLINATLNDNGTYTCSVRNPPDVHGYPTSHTVLTVTPKVPSIRFSDVAVLLAFILLPSAVITLFLIGRTLCPKKHYDQSKAYRLSIEVTQGEEYDIYPPEAKGARASCCDRCLTDSEDEDYNLQKRPPVEEVYAESQC